MGLSSSFIGNLLSSYQDYIVKAGGFVLVIMGLFYLNIIRIPVFNREKVIQLKEKPIGLAGSFVVGITFSLGWTPCIGPVLSSILVIASTSENVFKGVYLLGLYALGMAIPFLISSLLCNKLIEFLRRYGYMVKYSMKILGGMLIIVGLLLITSYFGKLSLILGQVLTF
jgi:cytochrome c-type biogenesis protein